VQPEYSDYERLLLRRALSPAPTSSLLILKAQSISDLAERGVPVPLDRIRAELESVLSSRLGTFQEARAQGMAQRLVAMLDGEPEEPQSREDELGALCHEGWETLMRGDVEEADRLHQEWAEQSNWHKWDRLWVGESDDESDDE
jgi:hypothetical protein